MPIDDQIKEQIIKFLEEEARHIGYGKLLIEINVMKCVVTNIQCETRRSKSLDKPKNGY